nr:hypothetical protein [Geopsychrobacter electrodiphilus]
MATLRLRPILMTTGATVLANISLALLPRALRRSAGSLSTACRSGLF